MRMHGRMRRLLGALIGFPTSEMSIVAFCLLDCRISRHRLPCLRRPDWMRMCIGEEEVCTCS
jgi:hypothetical protein